MAQIHSIRFSKLPLTHSIYSVSHQTSAVVCLCCLLSSKELVLHLSHQLVLDFSHLLVYLALCHELYLLQNKYNVRSNDQT